MPGRLISKLYFARPVTLSGPSRRLTRVLSTAGFAGHAYFFAFAVGPGGAGAGAGGFCALATGHLPRCRRAACCRERSLHDSHEGAAAADVAVESLLHLIDCRLRMFLDERDGGHHEAGGAEAAHQRVAVAERLLHRVESGAVGEAVDRPILVAGGCNRGRRARFGGPAVGVRRAGAALAAVP